MLFLFSFPCNNFFLFFLCFFVILLWYRQFLLLRWLSFFLYWLHILGYKRKAQRNIHLQCEFSSYFLKMFSHILWSFLNLISAKCLLWHVKNGVSFSLSLLCDIQDGGMNPMVYRVNFLEVSTSQDIWTMTLEISYVRIKYVISDVYRILCHIDSKRTYTLCKDKVCHIECS